MCEQIWLEGKSRVNVWANNCVNRFRAIDKADRYTDKPAPTLLSTDFDFEGKFHDLRQMIEAFNDHMAAKYTCCDWAALTNPWISGLKSTAQVSW